MGSDWQDSLNSAIQNCNFFVPLITPMYGRTQWTNREVSAQSRRPLALIIIIMLIIACSQVKLADVLRKHIIPINFRDIWPPECLAIQFATTQYIPWRPTTGTHTHTRSLVHDQVQSICPQIDDAKEKDPDGKKAWDQESIDQVTKQLVGQITKLSKKETKPTTSSNTELHVHESVEAGSGVDRAARELNNISGEKPLVVISAHPNQYLISIELKKILTPAYQVWCSNDISDNVRRTNEDLNPKHIALRDSIYDPNLSPIIEENSALTHAIQDYARKIAENAKQRPKSVPNHESTEFKLEVKKKDLARVVSYNGEVSYLSSISPDKMERLKSFQEKVLSSTLVIIIASEQYYMSRTSEQHVYYCGQRKKTILVQCDKSAAPVWFSKLMSHDVPLVMALACVRRETATDRLTLLVLLAELRK